MPTPRFASVVLGAEPDCGRGQEEEAPSTPSPICMKPHPSAAQQVCGDHHRAAGGTSVAAITKPSSLISLRRPTETTRPSTGARTPCPVTDLNSPTSGRSSPCSEFDQVKERGAVDEVVGTGKVEWRLAIPDHEGLLRVRVEALGATGERFATRDEVAAALRSLTHDDGLLADLEPATRRILESVMYSTSTARTD